MYVYLLAIASEPKRFSVESERMRCVQSDGPRALNVSSLKLNDSDSAILSSARKCND